MVEEEEKRRGIIHTVLTSFVKLETRLFGSTQKKNEESFQMERLILAEKISDYFNIDLLLPPDLIKIVKD